MDVLGELRAEMYNMVTNREMVPEVQLLINMAKREVKRLYDSQYVLDDTMNEYIETQFEAIKSQLKQIKENKDTMDFEMINNVVSNIGMKVEEVSQNAKAFDEEPESDRSFIERGKQHITTLNMREESMKTTRNVVGILDDVIEDIRNRGNRRELLDPNKIEELNYSISQLKNYINSQMPQELVNSLDKDNQKLLQQVSEKFEQYFYMEKNNQQKEEDSQKDTFKKQLDAGISLEQQSENAKIFMDKQDEQKEESKENRPKALPDNVIE